MARDTHISDLELMMAADGELSAKRMAKVGAHLDRCEECRKRRLAMDMVASEFANARDRVFEERIADAAFPRALLRARLAEVSGARVKAPWKGFLRLILPTASLAAACIAIVMVFGTTLGAKGLKPRANLTPGETRPITISEVCRTRQAEVVAAVPEDMRRRVFAAYGIRGDQKNFEVDYLITPDLGGSGSLRNLWPQPYGVSWNAHAKDELEQRLHELVCGGQLDLATAQRAIATDWIGAYRRYVGPNRN
ncbi:MAG TPA: zf-HC2 domain-containing protein [Bryobacteraceae bacterium]|nr:zf-HC2 domain-containing protein [Bryobacteraceae bacterium]